MKIIIEKEILPTIRLTNTQKEVMTRIIAAPTEKLAAEQIMKGRNKIAARDILIDLQLIEADHKAALVTPEGIQVMKDYNLLDDQEQLTDEGSTYAYDEEDQPVAESLLKQVNTLVEGRMKELSMQVDELLKNARTHPHFAAAYDEGNKKAMESLLLDEMGKVGDDPSDDIPVVKLALEKLFSKYH
jgi:hypothetical protein